MWKKSGEKEKRGRFTCLSLRAGVSGLSGHMVRGWRCLCWRKHKVTPAAATTLHATASRLTKWLTKRPTKKKKNICYHLCVRTPDQGQSWGNIDQEEKAEIQLVKQVWVNTRINKGSLSIPLPGWGQQAKGGPTGWSALVKGPCAFGSLPASTRDQ